MSEVQRIGILTSGGDSPGMNAAVVSVARCATQKGLQLMGIKRGYNGLLSSHFNEDVNPLDLETVLDIMDMRGTYLRTARCKEFFDPEIRREAAENLLRQGIQALVVIGGDGSYQGAMRLCELGIPCVGIPGTIDNDLGYTEATLGYDTAVNVCVEAVRSIRATSRSHDRPHVVQVMGRYCGDIALRTAIATGAEMVVVPEKVWDIRAVAERLKKLIANGNTRATLVISEHCWDDEVDKDKKPVKRMEPFNWQKLLNDADDQLRQKGKDPRFKVLEGEPLRAERLAQILTYLCDIEVRSTVIGYTQRGAIPTAYDSAFAFEAGHRAVELLTSGAPELNKGYAIGVRNGSVYHTPFADALDASHKKVFNEELYQLINTL